MKIDDEKMIGLIERDKKLRYMVDSLLSSHLEFETESICEVSENMAELFQEEIKSYLNKRIDEAKAKGLKEDTIMISDIGAEASKGFSDKINGQKELRALFITNFLCYIADRSKNIDDFKKKIKAVTSEIRKMEEAQDNGRD